MNTEEFVLSELQEHNKLLSVEPKIISLFWLCGLYLSVWLFRMYESRYAISHKIGLYALPLRYE